MEDDEDFPRRGEEDSKQLREVTHGLGWSDSRSSGGIECQGMGELLSKAVNNTENASREL